MNDNLNGVKETSNFAENMTIGMMGLVQKLTDQSESFEEITPDLAYITILMVNVCFFGSKDDSSKDWVLIDAGLPSSTELIEKIAENRFGKNIQPKAIILTHGHFDHVGALTELIKKWDVPVYAHKEELPYLTGKKSYPDGAPLIEKGLMAKLSPLYPNKPIDLGSYVHPLPDDKSLPGMQGWRWIHTPGHTPGHVALFRDSDRVLIAGDAFTTVNQESAIDVLSQKKEINTPPAYYTPNWKEALESINTIKALNPSKVITGHGKVMYGDKLRKELDELASKMQKYSKNSNKLLH